ncbi:MAG: hypothetical protein K9G36_01915 [Crocinitomicaceae bacterium]|jgi:hypothetical protein|nr:hypothetical protein [Crocinitomicaceae bacterium]MCF8444447.1 hypothetical protein [Crocinitomicaceae bacterium]
MVIQIQKFKYEIQEVQLAEKMVETLYKDYQTSFPGFEEILDSWDSNYIKEMITGLISKILIFQENVNIENPETLENTDEDTNLEWLLIRKISDYENSVIELPDSIATNEKAINVYYRFILRSIAELMILIGYKNYPIDIFKELSDDPDLLYTKKIKDNLNKHYPGHKRDYNTEPFKFIGDYVKLLNPPELSKSILVTSMTKTEFEEYLDHLFPGDEILNKEVKKRFKSWFHYSKNQEKDIEPFYFEDDDNQPYYIAYFLKFSGITQEKKTKFNVLAYIKKSNEWLDNNLLSRKSESRFSNFADLEGSLEKYSREIVKNEIDSNLETYKLQKKKPN